MPTSSQNKKAVENHGFLNVDFIYYSSFLFSRRTQTPNKTEQINGISCIRIILIGINAPKNKSGNKKNIILQITIKKPKE